METNPQMQQMMQSAMSNPAMVEMALNSNPQMRAMVDANPHMRQMLSNPQLLQVSLLYHHAAKFKVTCIFFNYFIHLKYGIAVYDEPEYTTCSRTAGKHRSLACVLLRRAYCPSDVRIRNQSHAWTRGQPNGVNEPICCAAVDTAAISTCSHAAESGARGARIFVAPQSNSALFFVSFWRRQRCFV